MSEKTAIEITRLDIHDPTSLPMEEAETLRHIFSDALKSYSASGMSPHGWSRLFFRERFPEKSDEEINQWADEISETLSSIETKKNSIAEARKKGIGIDDWFAKDVQSVTAQLSGQEAEAYLKNLDAAVQDMNKTWSDAVLRKDGMVNMNPNLDGFMAEAHHVNSFNANAAANGSGYRAKMLTPGDKGYSKNSVDIVITDETGRIVRKYQSKYGNSDSQTTGYFKDGDYRGQRKLVPKGQNVSGSTDHIEMDGIKSDPLSKDAAKSKQSDAQSSGKAPTENYNAFDTKVMLKHIGKDVAVAGAIGAGMNVAFEIGSKLAYGEDVEFGDVAVAAIKGGGGAAVKTAAASAVKVAIEKEVIKAALPLKGTPLAPIVAAIDIGVSNVKTMFKIGSGEISAKDGMNEIESTTVAGVTGVLGFAEGASVGAAIGSIVPGIGTAIGGFIGGLVGGFAGSTVGRAITKGVQAVRKTVWNGIKAVGRGIRSIGEKISNGLRWFVLGW